ncbi:hypothetical protein MVEN_00095200 [Mycena venus]|uniref:Uncharacterized protein n=1 Tax=Mycena venus TaxID=2733690 RepID=A0A8H6ZAX8_9AGAR|nr:hypothetical protein MVEN_00095200 [Mycena venus]
MKNYITNTYSPKRLSTCPLTIHVLLHIADGIEAAGPVWAYWTFPMERFCGRLQPYIKSRRYPFARIDGHVVAMAQLSIAKVTHSLDLRLGPPKLDLANGAFQHPSYTTCALLPPRRLCSDASPLDPKLARKIITCLATRYNQEVAIIKKYFNPNDVELWAKVQRLEGGDQMLASSMMNADTDDRRDATYVRYVLLADINAKYKRIAPRFEPVTVYGQLQHICVVKPPPAPELKLKKEDTLILAAVRRCEIEAKNDLDMHYYRKEGGIEVVDMSTI